MGMPYVDFSSNLLTGTVPATLLLGDQVHLQDNLFTSISTEIGALPSPSRLLLNLGNNMISSVPTELFLLTTLQRLHLSGNKLTHLPAEVGQMGKDMPDKDAWNYCWLDLDVSDNQLSMIPNEIGSIPTLVSWVFHNNLLRELPEFDWENLQHVQSVDLSHNLFETFPSTPFLLPELLSLDLSSNLISGNTSEVACNDSMFSWCTLKDLNLSNNSIGGSVSSTLGTFTDLTSLNLALNLLTGTFPTFFDRLPLLTTLDLSDNQFQGAFPLEIQLNATSLYNLILSNNSLTGSIPSQIAVLTNLEVLDISSNELSGSIPSELGQIYTFFSNYDYDTGEQVDVDWTYLHTLNMSHNNFSGRIPSQVGELTNLQVLDLSINKLTGHIPSELGLINATEFEWERYGTPLPVSTQISLQGNSFTGTLPSQLCSWHCNGQDCLHHNKTAVCKTSFLVVDCIPISSLDCSVCAC
jgi:Leucine-rich repeat (LRR) protein